MIAKSSKDQTRQKVHSRIRKKVQGTQERPRLNVYRSVNHIYAQVIDDAQGRDPGLGYIGREGQRDQGRQAANRR